MTLADGCQYIGDSYNTMITIEKKIPMEILALPEAKSNTTLLGTDFLEKSDTILHVKNKLYFHKNLYYKVPFEVLD